MPGGANQGTAQTFEKRIEREVRRLEADVTLCLNYVRKLASRGLNAETIDRLELEHEARLAEIDNDD